MAKDKKIQKKKEYSSPKLKSEKIELAELGAACNGMAGGPLKAVNPCSTLLS